MIQLLSKTEEFSKSTSINFDSLFDICPSLLLMKSKNIQYFCSQSISYSSKYGNVLYSKVSEITQKLNRGICVELRNMNILIFNPWRISFITRKKD